MVVCDHFLDRESSRLRRLRLHARDDLRAGPYFAGVGLEMNRRVDRLHRRMREKRQLVRRFKPVAGSKALGDVASRFRDHAILFARGAQILPNILQVKIRVRTFFPVYHQRIEALLGRPHVIADHRDQIVQHDHLLHARNFPGGAVVDLGDLAAENRTGLQGCEFHIGQHRVDAVDGLAVDLVGGVEPLQRLADQPEILRILEWNILSRILRVRCIHQLAIGEFASALRMHDLAIGGRAACRFDLPSLRGGLNQHGARAGAGSAQGLPPRPNRIGIAGGLNAEKRIAVELVARRRVLHHHLRKIGIKLLSEDHRYRSIGALPHDRCG